MKYSIHSAQEADMGRVEEIYAHARAFMAAHGNPNQWGSTHPPREQLEQDIAQGKLYTMVGEGRIHGVFFFSPGEDPAYARIENGQWHSHRPYGVIHRIAGDGSGGILAAAVAFGKQQADYLRIDTHEDNAVMQQALQKQGFRRCGIIHLADGSPRIAYDWLAQEA